jgi:hypothetical protein
VSSVYGAAAAIHSVATCNFIYTPDDVQFKEPENWPSFDSLRKQLAYGVVRDDCDGFARLCQMLLLDHYGLSAAVLTCQVENGGWHLVCEVGGAPDKSGWVLDNRRDAVTTRERLAQEGYTFWGYAQDGVWVQLNQSEIKS